MMRKKSSGTIRLLACALIAVGFAAPAGWTQPSPAQARSRVIQKKTLAQKEALGKEWTMIMQEHPKFARVFLAQQLILMDASKTPVAEAMCDIVGRDLPVLFEDHWIGTCQKLNVARKPPEAVDCLTRNTNRDPAGCFTLDQFKDWYFGDDPRKGSGPMPPEPPDPHLK